MDLAYTLLKIGESEQARDQFGEAMRIQPDNNHVALEYAFLCYETKMQAIARRIFDRIRAMTRPRPRPSKISTGPCAKASLGGAHGQDVARQLQRARRIGAACRAA